MDDLISRAKAINAADIADYTGLAVEDVKKVTDEVIKEIKKIPSAERVENIPFGALKMVCRYHTLSYDADKGVESACHSTANMKDGESWGKCNEHDCPFWKETEDE